MQGSGGQSACLGERQKSAAILIPEVEVRAAEALPKRDAFGLCQNLVILDHFGQAIKRNSTCQMMNMVDTDIASDPA